MGRYFSAACWAMAIVMLATAARFGVVDRAAADLLLMILPGIAFITLLNGAKCRTADVR